MGPGRVHQRGLDTVWDGGARLGLASITVAEVNSHQSPLLQSLCSYSVTFLPTLEHPNKDLQAGPAMVLCSES